MVLLKCFRTCAYFTANIWRCLSVFILTKLFCFYQPENLLYYEYSPVEGTPPHGLGLIILSVFSVSARESIILQSCRREPPPYDPHPPPPQNDNIFYFFFICSQRTCYTTVLQKGTPLPMTPPPARLIILPVFSFQPENLLYYCPAEGYPCPYQPLSPPPN